jgi:hypothetical protein
MSQQRTSQPEILSGWKEIANYLRKGVRTVQRYEREMGLPIHRPGGRSSPVAMKTELDEWLTAPRSRIDSVAERRASKSRTNKLIADFLRIDSDIALTFASIALDTIDPEKRSRTVKVARKAYDTIVRMCEKTHLREADRQKLEVKLRRLQSKLESLGQSF